MKIIKYFNITIALTYILTFCNTDLAKIMYHLLKQFKLLLQDCKHFISQEHTNLISVL